MLMRLWRSAAVMTWMALGVRLGGFAVLLPLILTRFSAAEVSVWLLFSAVVSFQVIADFGFGPTFSREIAYGFAGHSLVEHATPTQFTTTATVAAGPNWRAIGSATAVMLWLYRWLAFATLLLIAVFGTWAVLGPIGRVAQPNQAWLAWVAVVLTTAFSIYGNAYASFLIGANRIETQKRWESVVAAISLLCQSMMVGFGAGLMGLVLVAQISLVVQVFVNRKLSMSVSNGRFGDVVEGKLDQRVLRMMWPSAWRTAVGAIMSIGISQGMVIAMANLLVAAEAASVQLALRVMQIITQISQVPFYTKIPVLNRIRADKNKNLLAATAVKLMRISLWIYVVCAILVGIGAQQVLIQIGSQTRFPAQSFWMILTLAVFLERFGAMHIQLLLTSNKAIAHIANSLTGIIWIIGWLILFPKTGAPALPISMFIAYIFYSAYAATFSHRELKYSSKVLFEARSSVQPLIFLLTIFVLQSYWSSAVRLATNYWP